MSDKSRQIKSIAVSACLLGVKCRYDGGDNYVPDAGGLLEEFAVCAVCPECLGGLGTPRAPSEIRDGAVVSESGDDVTENFRRGAEKALEAVKKAGCVAAVMKARSPSCGSGEIYDGTFSGRLCRGYGVCAALFRENGIEVFDETHIAEAVQKVRGGKGSDK